jgi:hypothetical protein
VFDYKLVSFDHLSADNNGLWFMLLNWVENNADGRIIQLILHTLSDHSDMMIAQNSKQEYSYEWIVKNQVSYMIMMTAF